MLNSGSFWGQLNGIFGRFFGNGDQRVFFAAAGYRMGGNGGNAGVLYDVGNIGRYWSSTPRVSLYFSSENANTTNYDCGLSVRCVKE